MNDHAHNIGVVDLTHRASRTRTPHSPVVLSSGVRRYPAGVLTRTFVTRAKDANSEVRVALLSRAQMFFARVVSALLILLMLVSPVARVYADETLAGEESSTIPVAETISDVEIAPPPPITPIEAPQVEDVAITEVASFDFRENEPTGENDASGLMPPASEESTSTPPTENNDDIPAEVDFTETEKDDEPTSEGDGGGSTGIPDALSSGTSTEEVFGGDATSTEEIRTDDEVETSDVPQEDATTTEEVSAEEAPPEEVSGVTSTDESAQFEANRIYQEERLRAELRKEVEQEFLRGCISFEQSGYYCLKDGTASGGDMVARKKSVSVISEQGEGGDKEIYVMRDTERILLTANDWDDTFPTQDVTSEQFVWQGMKSGRWQIFTGTLTASGSPVVTQVTDSHESNFNPKIDGEHLVWQGWADDNWEIFFATKRDAESPFAGEHLPEGNALLGVGPEWAVERLTKNSEQDMFPSLHGDLITWQSREGNDWVVYAYSIGARKQTKLSSDGVKSENPRFSITWEERDEEGNARLVGYDLATGEKTDLTQEAMKLPRSSFPEPVNTPIAQSDPAALPAPASSGSSTPPRADDEGGAGDNPPLP